MGTRRTKSIFEFAKTRSYKIGIVVHKGEVVAFKMTPRGIAALRKATPRLLLAEDDPHTPRENALQVGSWLGVRLFFDVRGAFVEKHSNGQEEH